MKEEVKQKREIRLLFCFGPDVPSEKREKLLRDFRKACSEEGVPTKLDWTKVDGNF